MSFGVMMTGKFTDEVGIGTANFVKVYVANEQKLVGILVSNERLCSNLGQMKSHLTENTERLSEDYTGRVWECTEGE